MSRNQGRRSVRPARRAAALAFILSGGLALTGPALAQRQIDDPNLSPMLFGPTNKEERDKLRQDQRDQEEAALISAEQDRDANTLDDPKVRPLIFGDSYDDNDPVAGRVTLGEKDNNRGFFGALNFLIPEETNLSLGVGPIYKPDYFGSDDYEFNADPQVYVKFRNFVFLDDDGADFGIIGFSRFRRRPVDQNSRPPRSG